MIKFFRHIRKALIEKNQMGKYFKYAIGEILLVMVGILLALQVNEWNKERNRKSEEKVIIEQLIEDLKMSQTDLQDMVKVLRENAKSSAIVCHAFWKKDLPHDSIFGHMRRPMGTATYSPTLGTAKSLISSGNIAVIKSDSIKNHITSYVEKVDYKLKDINRYEETYYRKGVELIMEIGPYSLLRDKSDFDEFFKGDPVLWNGLPRNDKMVPTPNTIDRIPFEIDKAQLFNNKKVYTAYGSLIIAHRNSANRYNDILILTEELLDKLKRTRN